MGRWVISRYKWLLVGSWLTLGFLSVVHAGFDDGLAAYEQGDYATAFSIWKLLAEQGDAYAQTSLGWMCEMGQDVPQDYKEAVKWYRKAA